MAIVELIKLHWKKKPNDSVPHGTISLTGNINYEKIPYETWKELEYKMTNDLAEDVYKEVKRQIVEEVSERIADDIKMELASSFKDKIKMAVVESWDIPKMFAKHFADKLSKVIDKD